MHDLVATLGKPVAHFVGVRRDLDVDFKSAPGKETLRLRGKQRQVLHALKHHDGELGLGLDRTEHRRQCDAEHQRLECHAHRAPPVFFVSRRNLHVRPAERRFHLAADFHGRVIRIVVHIGPAQRLAGRDIALELDVVRKAERQQTFIE